MMIYKKNAFVKILFTILFLLSFQVVKSQPRVELGGGIEIVRYKNKLGLFPGF